LIYHFGITYISKSPSSDKIALLDDYDLEGIVEYLSKEIDHEDKNGLEEAQKSWDRPVID
jgi:hypothetical protein